MRDADGMGRAAQGGGVIVAIGVLAVASVAYVWRSWSQLNSDIKEVLEDKRD